MIFFWKKLINFCCCAICEILLSLIIRSLYNFSNQTLYLLKIEVILIYIFPFKKTIRGASWITHWCWIIAWKCCTTFFVPHNTIRYFLKEKKTGLQVQIYAFIQINQLLRKLKWKFCPFFWKVFFVFKLWHNFIKKK